MSELSAKQVIHTKFRDLFSLKTNKKMLSAAVVIGIEP